MRTSIALLCLSGLAMHAAAAPLTPDEIMQRVRQATGIARARVPESGLEFSGRGTIAGLPSEYTFLFDRAGRFVETSNARVNTASGFDGVNVWTLDIGGEIRIMELSDRAKLLLAGLLKSGLWIDADSGMSYTLGEESAGACTLKFTHAKSGIRGTISIDSTTWLPTRCAWSTDMDQDAIEWSGTVEFEGLKLPAQWRTTSGHGKEGSVAIEKIRPAPAFLRSPYEMLDGQLNDVTFDSSLPAELETKRAHTGHILVHPRVNGKDVGWFILDSGAGANVLSASVIKDLAIEEFGDLPAIGVAGAVKTHFSRPDSISLGRMTLKSPLVVGLDLKFLDIPMGVPIAGIIGYSSFHRSITEIDMQSTQVSLFDPKDYDQSRVGDHWQKLYQVGRIACVEAEFEGHKGIFKLDTGAAGSTVAIHAPTVEKFKLLEGRETTPEVSGGVGGGVLNRAGKLAYFELAGTRVENVAATFSTQTKGAFASSETLGNIGGDLVKPFRIVFDYRGKRIAFLKREVPAK